jgi:hypothetical protein
MSDYGNHELGANVLENEFTQETQNTSEADPTSAYDSAGGIKTRAVVSLSPLSHPKTALTFSREVPSFEGKCPCKPMWM